MGALVSAGPDPVVVGPDASVTVTATQSKGIEAPEPPGAPMSSLDVPRRRLRTPPWLRVFSIFYFMSASIATQSATKAVMTSYGFTFPLVLALAQMLFAVPVCAVASRAKLPTPATLLALAPLGLINGANIVAGMAGTSELSVPMFIVLRRFTMVFTLLIERFAFRQRQALPVLLAVAIMMSGALVAAAGDLSFNAWGYAAVFTTDALTAANLVLLKRHPVARELDTALLLFYNSLISLGPIAIAAVLLGDVQRAAAFTGSTSLGFRVSFAACVCLGLSTSHSTYMCTRANEPLTTTVAGSLKNVLMTVIGAFAFGDYSYSHLNAGGIALSMAGAVWYASHQARASARARPMAT